MTSNWLIVALVAQIILGSSAVFDKLLLRKRSIEPWAYTFWLGIFGGLAIVLLPFGFQVAGQSIVILALVSGILFIASSLFFFSALEFTEVSEALPIMGALVPIFTLGLAALALGSGLGRLDFIGFALLVASGLLLAAVERASRRRMSILLILAAGLLAAGSTVAAKAVFDQTNFITGFFWIKIGGVLTALFFLCMPHVRKRILAESEHAAVRSRLAYFANRGYAGFGSLLAGLAISLGSPALVEATSNFRYLVIFTLGALLLRERFRGRVLAAKLAAAALITVGLSWLALGEYARSLPPIAADRPITWGVTFSARFSRELGLNPEETLTAILGELRPKNIRLVAYWNEIEAESGRYDFSDLDWQLDSARAAGTEVVLVAGLRVPRWPECHIPEWAASAATEERETALRRYLAELVKRYRARDEIAMWQIENEPFLAFGQCHERGEDFLGREIALVKSLDPIRPILTTDGGELGLWARAAKSGDVFGTTMYRKVYPRFIGPLFGIVEYPIGPGYFRVKGRFIRWWNGTPDTRFIVSELQGEPWFPTSLARTPYEAQLREFSPEYFRDTIDFAKAAGFDEYYLWGAEWWLWMKEKHGDSRYWDLAKTVLAPR